MRRIGLAALCAALATAPPASGQAIPRPAGVTVRAVPDTLPHDARAGGVATFAPPSSRLPLARHQWVRPVASLLVPGSGQLLAGQPRGLVYLATEVWLLARAVGLRRDSRNEGAFYRSLAYTVARGRFGYQRADGPWPYYEEMGKYIESGVFNSTPASGLTPETDTATFNGHLWALARETYFENPDSTPDAASPAYRAALRFYQTRGVTEGYRWSWRDARLEQDAYRASIRASDDAYRAATNYLGAVLLNHLVSAVDAFIGTRLGRRGMLPVVRPAAGGPGTRLEWRTVF